MPHPAFADRRLYLLLTRSLCLLDPLETLEAALASGADLIQVREKPFEVHAEDWVRAVVDQARPYGVPVIINDCIDLAQSCGGLGVHLGQGDLEPHAIGSLRQRDYPLGLSTHDESEMERALIEEPDYVGVGPCHATDTKGYRQGLGPGRLEALLDRCPIPAFGIGGIHPGNLPDLLGRGLRQIAVSSCILGAADPGGVTSELRKLLDQV